MTWAVWFLAAWIAWSALLIGVLWVADRMRASREFQRSAREAAKGRRPSSGVPREVFDQETPVIPPSREVRDHAHGRSVADAADADPVRIQLDATWNLPAAQERRTP